LPATSRNVPDAFHTLENWSIAKPNGEQYLA